MVAVMIHMIMGSTTGSSIMHTFWPQRKMSAQCNSEWSSLRGLVSADVLAACGETSSTTSP